MRRVVRYVMSVSGALLFTVSCAWSGDGSGTESPPPSAPAGVTAAAGSATSVHVMWNRSPDGPEVAAYEVYRGATKVREVPGTERMVDVVGLTPSTAYVFTVRARDSDGRSGPRSEAIRATTPAASVADTTAPTRPGRTRGRPVGSRSVQLSWEASADERGVVSYDVYQGTSRVHTVAGDRTTAVVTGLRPGTRYTFGVRARDASDNVSPAGAPVRVTTAPGTDDGRATAPAGFRAVTRRTDGAYYLDLSWIPPRADGMITEYEIQLDGRPATSLVWGGPAPRGRASYGFYVGRDAGVAYRVRIRARLPDGTWGGFSAERTAVTAPQ
ncbi:fibronectin type III domain-containing protein [Streptomyces sp. AK08-02]|uniref:fibronectin type III domain-containing protein n=1 Tax=Streptomyces sp. AK08-02 TaxID=3028654 RepID=UPI0029AE4321|nr:fibronectin type III domain-containing protein [Streptomyces sp. AK08-02]MDX3745341.1 fibronectin type III domain-containing protein [Streptomyces sp. AK08-02]